jgi:hypothetical protein
MMNIENLSGYSAIKAIILDSRYIYQYITVGSITGAFSKRILFMMLLFYYITIIFYGLVVLSNILRPVRYEFLAASCALIANLISLALIFYQGGHFPVYNTFESFLFASLMMGCAGLLLPKFKGYMPKVRLYVWCEILMLLGISLLFPKVPATTGYDYGYIYKVLFHMLRPVSMSIMLISTAYFIQFILQREQNERTSMLAHMGRNYLLLSTVTFLLGEYVGIVWCQKGWGDFWMWNQDFLQSTIIIVYLMLAFHIPLKGRRAEDLRAFIGGLSGVVMVTLTVIRSYFA